MCKPPSTWKSVAEIKLEEIRWEKSRRTSSDINVWVKRNRVYNNTKIESEGDGGRWNVKNLIELHKWKVQGTLMKYIQ